MKRTDHILALTTTLLRAPEADVDRLLAIVENLYSLQALRKPGAVSIGFEQGDTEEPFTTWLRRLRSEQIQRVHVSYHAFDEREDMPAHMAAAFAGTPDLLLRVKTAQQIHAYALTTYFGPQYELTPQQFITLLDSQADKAHHWDRAAELILESNGMNNHSLFEPEETAEYLLSPEGHHVFEQLAPDLVKELQIECTVRQQPFIIPDDLQSLFVKYDYSFFDEDREYVYLYPLGDVSAQEVIDLVNAQPFGLLTWETLNASLQEYDPTAAIVEPERWEQKLRAMSDEDLEQIVTPLCRAICTLCEAGGVKPVIPEALSESFGPDEEEQKRAAARSNDKDRWNLQSTQNPWEHYAFRPVENAPAFTAAALADTEKTFVQALEAIHQFATRIDSPFQDLFRINLRLMQMPLPAGSFGVAQVEQLAGQLSQAEFPQEVVESVRLSAWVVAFCTELSWDAARSRGMLAVKFADVFGGMGSWNDQYIEEDHETFQKVSSELFEALKRYLASLL
ncbi:hypothetical protein [Parachryseolinea silvisoli]|uniref:hypothetical protein n=1 Tax=Parachryseolinea silvisoli TaxID=2873601 RepID=UPI002265D0C6|nr:hypothetical protein [Parachryseolinea silvisoli]MCD9015408.1 hypothetical protein [Parachryseolinea silvisoli]